MNPSSLLKMSDLKKRIGLSYYTIHRMVASGQFPAPVKISPKRVVWVAEEVDEWFQQRLNDRKILPCRAGN